MLTLVPWRLVEVAREHRLLEGPDIEVKHIKPLLIEANLVHVNVSGGHSFVASLQPLILKNGMSRGINSRILTLLLPSLHLPKCSASATKSAQNLSVNIGNQ